MNGSPWWYSGDEPDEPDGSDASGPSDASGQSDASGPSSHTPGEAPRVGADWGSLLSGAQRIVDWATETVMAPHAEHGDPREHPDCMICRAIALVGDVGREATEQEPTPTDMGEGPQGIEWIPIREDRPES